MTLASMTGFARAEGGADGRHWSWEVKTVNARGLDIRLRLPPGLDALETEARRRIAGRLTRGTCFANLTAAREGMAPGIRVNADALEALAAALEVVAARIPAGPPSLDGLLSVKGIIEITEAAEDEESRAAQLAAVAATLDEALAGLVAVRRAEGSALGVVLTEQLGRIATLTAAADDHPGRRPEAIRKRLEEQIATLLDAAPALDPDRLHQEAVLLAAKSDVREELDRLGMHVAAAQALLAEGGPVGRRLDFLAQELGRESNTLCAKSGDAGLTAIALELKAVVEQFREQVQNLE
jgi:uncharacterized protein (TIGR00255 family)